MIFVSVSGHFATFVIYTNDPSRSESNSWRLSYIPASAIDLTRHWLQDSGLFVCDFYLDQNASLQVFS